MAKKNIKETIGKIANRLNKARIKWALIGSSNLALQGMNIKPGGIGVLVEYKEKEKIEKLFKREKIIKEWELENKQGFEIVYLIEGVEVLFCFEYKHGFYYKFLKQNKFEQILLGKDKIYCNRLENEVLAYEFLGSKQRANEIKQFIYSKFDFDKFEKLLTFASSAYHNKNISGQAMRPGGPMPYLSHPLWAATMLANDRRLNLEERKLGFQALVLHDVLEDTSEKIPSFISKEVVILVKELTFKNWEEKKKAVRSKSKFVKLLLLADGLANMYEETIGQHKRVEYKKQVQYLLKECSKNYSESRMVQIGKAIIENTNW